MSVTFSKVTFVDGSNLVPINAANLNAIEDTLQVIADGGSGSGVDADTLRGKILTNKLDLSKDLYLNLSASSEAITSFPDETSPVYFQNEWRTLDSWSSPDSSATLSATSSHLNVAPAGGSIELRIARNLTGFQSKTLKLRIKNKGDFAASNPIRFLNGSSSYVPLTMKAEGEYLIGTIETDAVASTVLDLKIYLLPAATRTQEIDWIYVGNGEYSRKIYNSMLYGVTPISGYRSLRSFFFDGTNDKIVSTLPSLGLKDGFSLVMDVALLSNAGTKTLMRLGGTNSGFALNAASGNSTFDLVFYRSAGASETLASLVPLAETSKVIGITYKKSTKAWALYVDGEKITNGSLTYDPVLDVTSLYTGCSGASTNFTQLVLSSLLLYARDLTEQEVWELSKKNYCLERRDPTVRIRPKAPESALSEGDVGDVRFDSSYVYICIAPNTWKRATLTTW